MRGLEFPEIDFVVNMNCRIGLLLQDSQYLVDGSSSVADIPMTPPYRRNHRGIDMLY